MADKYFTYGSANVDQLLTTTLSTWADKNMNDQIFYQMPFLKKMYAKAKKKDGGASILVPVMYGKNATAGSYSGYDLLDTTPVDGFTTTQAKWKNNAVSITISGEQLRQNSGEAKILSLLDEKTNQAVESLRDEVTAQLFSTSVGSDDIESMYTMFDATSSIQDVNSTSYSWWQCTATTGGSFATQGLNDMRTTANTIDTYTPSSALDTIVTSTTVYNYYEASRIPSLRYASTGSAEGSFGSLLFRGAEMMTDANATSDAIYMFSSDDLYLVINSNGDYMTTPFVKPSNQDAKVAQVILMAQLVTRARRKLGVITSISA